MTGTELDLEKIRTDIMMRRPDLNGAIALDLMDELREVRESRDRMTEWWRQQRNERIAAEFDLANCRAGYGDD